MRRARKGAVMPDELDLIQERVEADTERAIENRTRFEGDSAQSCQECGNEIPQARRDALPGVQHCVDCAAVRERR